MTTLRSQLLLLLLTTCIGLVDVCQTPAADFVRDVQPILRKHCYQCHGHDLQEGGLRLDQKQEAFKGGVSGKAFVAGKSGDSRLIGLITGRAPDGLVMPPPDEAPRLNARQVQTLRDWIDAGAKWPDGVDPVHRRETNLWSFTPVVRPAIPAVKQGDWVRTPVDTFVLAKLEASRISPAEPAASHALLRRASFDLTGLPPTLNDLDAFQSDENWPAVVDRLLASPHYGERWARHWLDLVRYADTNGYEVDGEKPMAWKYRDYVIRAFNDDKPYDRFILEQLAGDELHDASPETMIATGFIRVGPWDAERGASVQPSEVVEERYNVLDDMVSTTSQVFLGLTMGCARCHDHKFDPLTAKDYYSQVAVFTSLKRERTGRSEATRPAVPPRELAEKNAADKRVAELQTRIRELDEPLRKGLIESGQSGLSADAVAAFATAADARNDNQKQLVQRFQPTFDKKVDSSLGQPIAEKFLESEARQEIASAKAEVAELRSQFNYPAGYFFYEPTPQPRETHLLKRGNPKQLGPVVQPAVPAAIIEQAGHSPPTFESPDDFTSRRRISLARWIASPDNPLTARVIVNRVWQYHFGVGIVRTPSDFGFRGAEPTHPELLDWLAHWFVHDADWSLKKLHRLIMTSNVYRMSKHPSVDHSSRDPDNRLLWRFPYRRLEVEAIRDGMLAVSGQLNASLYGASMYPHVPEDARRSGYNPQGVWKDFDEKDASRRTVYAFVKRTLVVPFLDTLDFCDTTRSAEQRDVTTVAPQALELLNGDFVNRQAKHFADRLVRTVGDESDIDQLLDAAFRRALTRPPTDDERQALAEYWRDELTHAGESPEASRHALAQVCRVIFNLNEFVYTD